MPIAAQPPVARTCTNSASQIAGRAVQPNLQHSQDASHLSAGSRASRGRARAHHLCQTAISTLSAAQKQGKRGYTTIRYTVPLAFGKRFWQACIRRNASNRTDGSGRLSRASGPPLRSRRLPLALAGGEFFTRPNTPERSSPGLRLTYFSDTSNIRQKVAFFLFP